MANSKKYSLLISLMAAIWIVPMLANANNCVWTKDAECKVLNSEYNSSWQDSNLEFCKDNANKPTSGKIRCCCASSVKGCCQKTNQKTFVITTVQSDASTCQKMDNADFKTIFFEEKIAVMNKCQDKKKPETCAWQTIEATGEFTPLICSSGQKIEDKEVAKKKCGAEPQFTMSVCCCNNNYNPEEMPFIYPKLQINLPGLTLTPTSSLKQKLLDDGSFSFSIPWIAEYIKFLYLYSVKISILMAGVIIITGGLLWLVSSGEASRVSKAKNLLGGSFIGLLIIMCAYLIFSEINPDINILKSIDFKKNIKPETIPNLAVSMGPVKVGDMENGIHFARIGKDWALPKPTRSTLYCPAARSNATMAEYKEKITVENIEAIREEIEKISASFAWHDRRANQKNEATAYNCVGGANYGQPGKNGDPRTHCDGTTGGQYLKNLNGSVNRFDCGGWVGYVYACAGLAVPGGPTLNAITGGKGGFGSKVYGLMTVDLVKKTTKPGDMYGGYGLGPQNIGCCHAMIRAKDGGFYDCGWHVNPETNAGCATHNPITSLHVGKDGPGLVTVSLEEVIKVTKEKFYDKYKGD